MEAIVLILLVVLVLAAVFGLQYLFTLGVVWCSSELFHYDLPFWPTFVAIILLSMIFGGRKTVEVVKK